MREAFPNSSGPGSAQPPLVRYRSRLGSMPRLIVPAPEPALSGRFVVLNNNPPRSLFMRIPSGLPDS